MSAPKEDLETTVNTLVDGRSRDLLPVMSLEEKLKYFAMYVGCDCIILDKEDSKPIYHYVEGVDMDNESVVCERKGWHPDFIKLLLYPIEGIDYVKDKLIEIDHELMEGTPDLAGDMRKYAEYVRVCIEESIDIFGLIDKGLAKRRKK